MFGRNRDTHRWGEGAKQSLEITQEQALRSVGNKVLSFDTWNGNITAGGKVRPAIERLEQEMGQVEAWEFLASNGCAYGTISAENVRMYNGS